MSGVAQSGFRFSVAERNRSDELGSMISRQSRSGVGVLSESVVLPDAISSVMASGLDVSQRDTVTEDSQSALRASSLQNQGHGGQESDLIEAVEELTEEVNSALSHFTSLRFSVEKDLDKVVIEVVDKDTDETVRQIPPDHMLALVKRMRELAGMLFDDMA
jgi:flagellar protein FlaG